MYTDVQLYINGEGCLGSAAKSEPIIDPATGQVLARVCHAGSGDLDQALRAADKGFKVWRKVSAVDRYKLLRKSAELIRSRADEIAELMTLEQGKPLAEAKMEPLAAGDVSFASFDEVVGEANRLPFGLAAYAWTGSLKTASAIGAAVESGMVSINHRGPALPETPFGGVEDSGYGSEGGWEAIEAYLNTKFITQLGLD